MVLAEELKGSTDKIFFLFFQHGVYGYNCEQKKTRAETEADKTVHVWHFPFPPRFDGPEVGRNGRSKKTHFRDGLWLWFEVELEMLAINRRHNNGIMYGSSQPSGQASWW
jgi:hypothetical protein